MQLFSENQARALFGSQPENFDFFTSILYNCLHSLN